jgi:hypothetical protein
VPRYDEESARAAVADSLSYTEALRKLGLRPAGGNHALFRKYVDEVWKISTDHFDQSQARADALLRQRRLRPLSEILVQGSSYNRRNLKLRLYAEGLKNRACEMCGQGEIWRGATISLILDHVNGVPDDNRLENLRIVCPNCNATLDTHCGRKNMSLHEQACLRCARPFMPKRAKQRYCSSECGVRYDRALLPRPGARKVERPSYEQLLIDLSEMSWLAVGHKYGVSGTAVRKWVESYEMQAARAREERAA